MRFLFLVLLMFSGCLPAEDDGGVIDMGAAEATAVEVDVPAEVKDERPSVSVFLDPVEGRCRPCKEVSKWWDSLSSEQKSSLPFAVHFCTDYPDWIEAYPTFYWEAGGEWWKHEGWSGPESFIKTFEQSIPVSSGKKKDGIASQSEQSAEINSSILSSESEPKSGDTVAVMPSSPWGVEQGLSSRKRRH